MKYKLFIITLILCFLPLFLSAQKVYKVDYESQADLKVYIVDYESQCDLKVYYVDYESQASKEGLWYVVKYESQADKKIYFVDYESQADLKIYILTGRLEEQGETVSAEILITEHCIRSIHSLLQTEPGLPYC